jgi:hypothetical protein
MASGCCTALQGTKACLGWDREPVRGSWACTAVTDAWLRLLTLAFHAARRVPSAEPPPDGRGGAAGEAAPDLAAAAAGSNNNGGSAARSNGEALNGAEETEARRATGDGASAPGGSRAAAAAASYGAALQQLLGQLLLHWKARPLAPGMPGPVPAAQASWLCLHPRCACNQDPPGCARNCVHLFP